MKISTFTIRPKLDGLRKGQTFLIRIETRLYDSFRGLLSGYQKRAKEEDRWYAHQVLNCLPRSKAARKVGAYNAKTKRDTLDLVITRLC